MKPKKVVKPTAIRKDWHKKIEESIKVEKVELDHPEGEERFKRVMKKMVKKKPQ